MAVTCFLWYVRGRGSRWGVHMRSCSDISNARCDEQAAQSFCDDNVSLLGLRLECLSMLFSNGWLGKKW